MPKRIGYLYDKVISLENCVQAERMMAKNKPDNRMARHIGDNAERYGAELSKMLREDRWTPEPNREFDLVDGYKQKTRHLKVPCLLDQSVQYAWMNIATPEIEKRNYYYNCGSIPGAGQTRSVRALQKWLGVKKPPRYGGICDIRHFYDTCPHEVVMKGLRRIFKDKQFLNLGQRILLSMSGSGTGLAIGHPSSHWFANVALMHLDHELCKQHPDVKFTRYMDDYAMVGNNKRKVRRAMLWLMAKINEMGMKIKRTWQIFRIKGRGLKFLSYRFYYGYTLLAKPLMYRIARRMRKAAGNLTVKTAAGVMSYLGILKHCDSYNFRVKHVHPFINIDQCKEVIRNAQKIKNRIRGEAGSLPGVA